jgi:hypothetical protein
MPRRSASPNANLDEEGNDRKESLISSNPEKRPRIGIMTSVMIDNFLIGVK